MRGPGLVIIPYRGLPELTAQALADARAQLAGACDVLLVCTGGDSLETEYSPRVAHLRYDPPLTSLAAVWNTALDYAWKCGYPDAMVWNNDVRVQPYMYQQLRDAAGLNQLLFVSPINCRDGKPDSWADVESDVKEGASLGGPDFSCFLIRPELHRAFRFDERFQPCYHEDNDYARRIWLAGRGAEIGSVPLPYLHIGSSTLNSFTTEERETFQRRFAACQQTYIAKWGGLPHQERKVIPDSPGLVGEGSNVGTPGGFLGATPVPEFARAAIRAGVWEDPRD